MEDQTRSLSEVAGLMGVSERTVRRWIKAGRLKAYKPGRDYRIPETGLRTFIEESEISPKEQASLPFEEPNEDHTERRSAYLEAFKKHMERRAAAWEHHASQESSRFFSDWRTSIAYTGEVSKEAYVLTRTALKELWPAIEQDFALEAAVREQRALVEVVKGMLKVVDKVKARDDSTLERARQEDVDHAMLEEARAEEERLVKERRAAFELLEGKLSA